MDDDSDLCSDEIDNGDEIDRETDDNQMDNISCAD
jgi:hypothetical protein